MNDPYMDGFLRLLNNWREWILNYFVSNKVTNAFVEGMNNKIKGNYSPLANVYLTSEDHLYCHQRIVAPICHGLQVAGDTAVSLSINACSETA